jgi:hypothetical protein
MPSIQQLAQQLQTTRQGAEATGSRRLAIEAEQLCQELHNHPATARARAKTCRRDSSHRARR